MASAREPVFSPIGAEDEGPTEVTSACMKCGEEGMTRLMFTAIPHFREIIVSSFECANEDCGEHNTEVRFGGALQPEGIEILLNVTDRSDMDRQLVKSEFCTVRIPELDFEIPAGQGVLSTVEGIISQTIDGLDMQQPLRRIEHPELAAQLDAFLDRLRGCLVVAFPYSIVLRDTAGNSYIQNPHFPSEDPHLHLTKFQRSIEDDKLLGLVPDVEYEPGVVPAADYNTRRSDAEETAVDRGDCFGATIPEFCFACKKPGFLKTAVVDIPHFKQTVIMAYACEYCGFKSNEVQTGGEVGTHGTRIELKVEQEVDLSRDVLKSLSCSVAIPELEFELAEGSLGSTFTTVEGLVSQMREQLQGVQQMGFSLGDSSTGLERSKFVDFLEQLKACQDGARPFTLVLDDPLSHTYIQSLAYEEAKVAGIEHPHDITQDSRLHITKYIRTAEQDEALGIDHLVAEARQQMMNAAIAGLPKPRQS